MSEAPRNKVMIAIFIVIIVVLASYVLYDTETSPETEDLPQIHEANIDFLLGGDNMASLVCVIANTTEERQTGLMYVSSLPASEGMLFIQDPPRNVTLWMKNVEIPLDMIFVNENLRVVSIEEAVVELPNTSDVEMIRYHSGQPVLYVIETNMDFCSENGIVPGTEITITFS